MYLKERLSKVGDFDESKVDAIFDIYLAFLPEQHSYFDFRYWGY